jgi:hypothetical protein|nr:hypothetical protein [Lacrimispora amygdalina]
MNVFLCDDQAEFMHGFANDLEGYFRNRELSFHFTGATEVSLLTWIMLFVLTEWISIFQTENRFQSANENTRNFPKPS